jgi:hypothetical protein
MNGAGGAKICDARVTAKAAGGAPMDLIVGNCIYQGGYAGTFVVEATRAGFKPASKMVTVPLGGDCHPVPQDVTLELAPL